MGTVHKFTLVDRLRKQSRAHKSISKTLTSFFGRHYSDNCIEAAADDIFEELWLDGFKIVPRDDGGRAA